MILTSSPVVALRCVWNPTEQRKKQNTVASHLGYSGHAAPKLETLKNQYSPLHATCISQGCLSELGHKVWAQFFWDPVNFNKVCVYLFVCLFMSCGGQFFFMSLRWLYRFVSKLSNNGVLYNPGGMASKARLPQDPNWQLAIWWWNGQGSMALYIQDCTGGLKQNGSKFRFLNLSPVFFSSTKTTVPSSEDQGCISQT